MTDRQVSQKDKVYQKIKQDIITQRVNAGEMLNERFLAAELGASRTPVREALKMLEKEGLVHTKPWRGTFVSEITLEDIEEIFELRAILEPQIIELVIPKLTDAAIARLDLLYDAQKTIYDRRVTKDFIGADRRFHMYLASLTENRRLIAILQNLNEMIMRLGVAAVTTEHKDRFSETLLEHMHILSALRLRDAFAAKNYMLLHILNTRDTVRGNWMENEKMRAK